MEYLVLFIVVLMVVVFFKIIAIKPKHTKKDGYQGTDYQVKTNDNISVEDKIQNLSDAKVKRVIDGDTVIVIENYQEIKIRLDSIDCPESGQQWGDVATYGLIKLIGGCNIRLEKHGIDKYDRTVATIYVYKKSEWVNVNERMVTLGHAWVMRRYYNHLSKDRKSKLNSLERWAKSKKIGLWQHSNPIPPWEWRCRT